MAPPSLAIASTIIGAVIGAAVTVARRAKPFRRSDCNLLLPRFFLIIALQENLGKVQAAVEPEDWGDFCDKLVQTLNSVREQLVELEGNLQWSDGFKKVTEEIDAELVTCLQKVPGGPSILDGYLPKTGQTWDALLGEKVEDERRFLDAEHNVKELQEDLTKSCLHAIKLLLVELQQENVLDARVVRSHDQGDYVCNSAGIVIQTYTIVKVFYATDRQITEDGDYIGEISRRAISEHDESNGDHFISNPGELPGVSSLQFGVVEIGIPHTHEVGAMEAPRLREESSPLKHVVIFSVDTKMREDRKEFLSRVNCELQQQQGELLIFIHGYNVSHRRAQRRN